MHRTTESRLLCPPRFSSKMKYNEIQCIGMINTEERRFSVPRYFLETV